MSTCLGVAALLCSWGKKSALLTSGFFSVIFLGFLIYAGVVFRKYRHGELNGDAEHATEVHEYPKGGH